MDIIEQEKILRDYEEWRTKLPYLNFKPDWQVKILPPWGGAIIRFVIKKNDIVVSVYFDCDDRLGYVRSPYWEIYATFSTGGQVKEPERFLYGEEDEMINRISTLLDNTKS